ncbi:MAG: alpha/beta fold hydrolase [Burkholderiaceae bacterium]
MSTAPTASTKLPSEPDSASGTASHDDSDSPGLFPEIQPFDVGYLDVGHGHRVHYEQCGNPNGLPVLFVHGGPASGFAARQRRFFDPDLYRIILLNQRGSGDSQPFGEQANNTTADLLADMEALRVTLKVSQWLLFGGSWGATLALAWAGSYPQHTLGLILRGVFLSGDADMDWFFRDAGTLVPDAWAAFAQTVGVDPLSIQPKDTDSPQGLGANLLEAYTRALANPDTATSACASWMAWEMSLMRAGGSPHKAIAASSVSENSLKTYQLQAAYLSRRCDLGEAAVLAAARRASLLPTAIVHGRLDWVCRPHNAWKIHQLMPGSYLRLVDRGGHDPYSKPMLSALVQATNCFAKTRQFSALSSEWIR